MPISKKDRDREDETRRLEKLLADFAEEPCIVTLDRIEGSVKLLRRAMCASKETDADGG
jgi:hypothetical protein